MSLDTFEVKYVRINYHIVNLSRLNEAEAEFRSQSQDAIRLRLIMKYCSLNSNTAKIAKSNRKAVTIKSALHILVQYLHWMNCFISLLRPLVKFIYFSHPSLLAHFVPLSTVSKLYHSIVVFWVAMVTDYSHFTQNLSIQQFCF